MSKINFCRSCRYKKFDNLFSLGNQYFTGIFPRSKNTKVPSGNLELIKCKNCSLVQLSENFSLKKMYGKNYGYRTGLNLSMVNHIKKKVQTLKRKINLNDNDLIIDIGSNDGTLLKCFDYNRYNLVGIDPTILKFRKYYPKEIKKISNFFSKKNLSKIIQNKKAKLITSIAMFYDLPDPTSFAKEVYSLLDDNGVWHLEQSYSGHMLKNLSYDTICHEHLEFYGLKQIDFIAKNVGLKIKDVEFNDINGGSFSVELVHNDSPLKCNETHIQKILDDEDSLGISNGKVFKDFSDRVHGEQKKLIDFLNDCKNQGKKVSGLGASTKGNVLLQ